MTAQSRFPVLSPADTEVARASCQRLAALLQGDRSLTLNVTGAHGEEAINLPAPVGALLLEILEGMAAGSPVAVLRKDAELTTQQAANVLNVSRPFLVDLLEQDALPFREVGTHRRVRIDDVLRYKNEVDAARRRALDELVAGAQELDMGY